MKESSPKLSGAEAEKEIRRLTRRSMLGGVVAAVAGVGAWRWLTHAPGDEGIPWPLRRMLQWNQTAAELLLPPNHLAATFSAYLAQGEPRTNGLIGLDDPVADWRLVVEHDGRPNARTFKMSEIWRLPRVDLVTELKCVEGWSEVMHFGGVRFREFVEHFGLGQRGPGKGRYRYVHLATPDRSYYVGLDMASAMHPQTLLCDTMNRKPLSVEHGAPLRLYLSVKYGYKSLKRVGLIRFTDQRPADFWAEQGYDWYAGL
jgi:DMSO/TMAO reductase YedYZ molybdopterin-dependent catalytic subunit